MLPLDAIDTEIFPCHSRVGICAPKHMDGCRQLAAEKAQLSHTLAALVAHDDGRNLNDPPPNATNITLSSAASHEGRTVERDWGVDEAVYSVWRHNF